MESGDRGHSESGMLVYPKLPVPRHSNPSRGPSKFGAPPKQIRPVWLIVAGLIVGAAGAYLLRPMIATDDKAAALEAKLAEADKAITKERKRADDLDNKLTAANAVKVELEAKLSEAAPAKASEAEKLAQDASKTKALDNAQTKLKAALEKGVGTVTTQGDEVRVQLFDRLMFKPNDDELTDKGRGVLGKIAIVLKELRGNEISVEGHTDDQPVPKPPPPRRPVKGAPPPVPRFATNWELASARALSVVHYLQDVAKIEPARLSAQSFGPYRPASRSNKMLNRRVEIVISPKR
jgi:chemotaxis protein MotB